MKKLLYGCLVSAILANSSPVFAGDTTAVSPSIVGCWKVTFFLEPTRYTGSTHCIVFKSVPGTVSNVPSSGTWHSPTFQGWTGEWIQLGDHVHFFGVTAILATFASGNIENNTHFGGSAFNHFSNKSASSSSSGSWTAVRVASCADMQPSSRKDDPAFSS